MARREEIRGVLEREVVRLIGVWERVGGGWGGGRG